MYVCMIARIRDGLPLVSCDNEQQDYSDVKTQARKFFKKLTTFDESMSTIDLNDEKHVFHYLLNQGVCYLTYCSKNYPTKLAFSFLSDLRESFNNSQSDQVQTATRPFQLVQFETEIQQLMESYQDSTVDSNLGKLNNDLYEVQTIIRQNIQEVLERGGKISKLADDSDRLAGKSKVYFQKTKSIKWEMWKKTYLPVIIIALVIIFVILIRVFVW
ncbi:vesicle-trafficking protein sec22b [Anaeramoeba flamelloides]|uniref:Vesicle-trafficking protein SEC22b n=2 Tax=Anaeramoeba flamelloides TaxID=1746091 RepID=A0AAV7Z4R4_9EUKA|nr:vesicle-trafficking protein sec22b [Anaeramoeba flamelloides]